jgi:hypothetical protein
MSDAPKPPPELTSILSQVQILQNDRERLMRELEEANGRVDKLQEGKREEMRKVLDTVITRWLTDSVQDEGARKQFTEGMERLVKDTKAESGVWTVACEASALHAKHLDELERLRTECETLRSTAGGAFRDEASRKRPREETASSSNDFWAGFELDTSRV